MVLAKAENDNGYHYQDDPEKEKGFVGFGNMGKFTE